MDSAEQLLSRPSGKDDGLVRDERLALLALRPPRRRHRHGRKPCREGGAVAAAQRPFQPFDPHRFPPQAPSRGGAPLLDLCGAALVEGSRNEKPPRGVAGGLPSGSVSCSSRSSSRMPPHAGASRASCDTSI